MVRQIRGPRLPRVTSWRLVTPGRSVESILVVWRHGTAWLERPLSAGERLTRRRNGGWALTDDLRAWRARRYLLYATKELLHSTVFLRDSLSDRSHDAQYRSLGQHCAPRMPSAVLSHRRCCASIPVVIASCRPGRCHLDRSTKCLYTLL
jgi:hypothetical protein